MANIILAILLATICSIIVALTADKLLAYFTRLQGQAVSANSAPNEHMRGCAPCITNYRLRSARQREFEHYMLNKLRSHYGDASQAQASRNTRATPLSNKKRARLRAGKMKHFVLNVIPVLAVLTYLGYGALETIFVRFQQVSRAVLGHAKS